MRVPAVLGVLAVASALAATALAAQDVEMLGEHYGTRPPAAYYELLARDPNAFQFAHGRSLRMRQRMLELARQTVPGAQAAPGAPMAVFEPRDNTVRGTFHIPVVLGLYSDSPAGDGAYTRDQVATAYFGDNPGTVKSYYKEVSGGLVTLQGDIQDWVRATVTQADATGGVAGLQSGTVGPFIISLLEQLPTDIDWGLYDNDGPDDIPNSGDDDGYVDALAVLQPTSGAECGGNDKDKLRIWSHKWNLTSAAGHEFQTNTPSAKGGYIKVDDYFIQPVLSCDNSSLNEIGVFTHESGHAFGLPDLYDTSNTKTNQGVGNWDLMSTGSWGCNGSTPEKPCHMGAWSKAMLGWVTANTVAPGTDLGTVTLPPVETSHTVYRIDAQDGSGEYFLLENRESLGFDTYVPGRGMLVWEIDAPLLAARWPTNSVNQTTHQAVRIRQADGRNDLGRTGTNRGDGGDPFPGTSGNTAFHAESDPSSRSWPGSVTGLTVADIVRAGNDVSMRLSTRFTSVTVTSQGDQGGGGLFTVDGAPVTTTPHTYTSAPFVTHQVEAAAGEPLGEGIRLPFLGWLDDPGAPRQRSYVTPMEDANLVAQFGGTQQVELVVTQTGGVNGVTPATFNTDPAAPDLWFAPGTTVKVEAVPHNGFEFLQWTGALAGQPNPATVVMNGPVQAGADFELTYAVAARTVDMVAAEEQLVELKADNANEPVTWTLVSGQVPDGLVLAQEGRLLGSPFETGTFPLVVKATDALGLTASASLALVISEPVIALDHLASIFLQAGPVLPYNQNRYLDKVGNDDGVYDLGDLRSWVLAHPNLPLTAPARSLIASPTVLHVGPVGKGAGTGAESSDGGSPTPAGGHR